MPSPEFYRSEADRLRAEASKGKGAEVSRLLRLAAEYDQLADSMNAIRSEQPRGRPSWRSLPAPWNRG
jgi:hypothetical protein